ncbi:MAG: hypothetical protein ACJ8HC_00115, partial [Paraburkholderia graminis]
MRTGAYLLSDYMTHAIGIDIAIPFDGLMQAIVAAALGIPYFRMSRRERTRRATPIRASFRADRATRSR